MAKNILKEAIADAKAVREVALANAKSALEEAFTPKLKSMLSAKLSEELEDDEEYDDDMDQEELDELVTFSLDDDPDVSSDVQSFGIDEDGLNYEEDMDLDELVNLEDVLKELEIDESGMEEGYQQKTYAQADDVQNVTYKASNIYEGCTDCNESKDFDIDKLLGELNILEMDEELELFVENDELTEQFGNVNPVTGRAPGSGGPSTKGFEYWQNHPEELAQRLGIAADKVGEHMAFWQAELEAQGCEIDFGAGANTPSPSPLPAADRRAMARESYVKQLRMVNQNLKKTNNKFDVSQKVVTELRKELNQVNLLNSKLLYVNRLFKANNLSESQKLRVVENLDKAGSVKESKLIYETLKESFSIKSTKRNPKSRKSIKEGLGIASRAAGNSTAPRNNIISESNNMVARFQKLANIKINQ